MMFIVKFLKNEKHHGGPRRSQRIGSWDRLSSILTLLSMALAFFLGLGWLAQSEAEPFAYVTNIGDNTVKVIRISDNTVVTTVPVGTAPTAMAITPDGAFAYVVNNRSNDVSVIRTSDNTVVTTVGVGSVPAGVAITPDGALAYVTNHTSFNVSVIRTSDMGCPNQPVFLALFLAPFYSLRIQSEGGL